MLIDNQEYDIQAVSRVLTVPDCNVLGANKLGTGNGEAKFYYGSKTELYSFTLGNKIIDCFFLKSDLINYMNATKNEYMHPSQNYAKKEQMPRLWEDRIREISNLPKIIEFTVESQDQIIGSRGYFNSRDNGYNLFRKLSLPFISYIAIMRLMRKGKPMFYWKLFVDFDAIAKNKSIQQVFSYGKNKLNEVSEENKKIQQIIKNNSSVSRDAAKQKKYRDDLLSECPCCPITRISDERLLIASHIKPYAVSTEQEAFDHKNGFMLSPLYDKLFDQGFISFDSNKCMMVSNWISPNNQIQCKIKEGQFIQLLPLDEQRESYLQYHRKFVFKG